MKRSLPVCADIGIFDQKPLDPLEARCAGDVTAATELCTTL